MNIGLCALCKFKKEIKSDKDSTFILCEYSKIDSGFEKYPPLPVNHCSAFSEVKKRTK